MSRATYQITVWSTYRSTTNTYFDNHELGVRPVHEYIRLCYNPELKLTNTDLYSRKHHSEINTARKNIAPIAAVACAVMDTRLSLDTCCDKRNFFFGGGENVQATFDLFMASKRLEAFQHYSKKGKPYSGTVVRVSVSTHGRKSLKKVRFLCRRKTF